MQNALAFVWPCSSMCGEMRRNNMRAPREDTAERKRRTARAGRKGESATEGDERGEKAKERSRDREMERGREEEWWRTNGRKRERTREHARERNRKTITTEERSSRPRGGLTAFRSPFASCRLTLGCTHCLRHVFVV